MVILKAQDRIDRLMMHYEEHEDHEGRTEQIDLPSSCTSRPSWLKWLYLRFLHNCIILLLYLGIGKNASHLGEEFRRFMI